MNVVFDDGDCESVLAVSGCEVAVNGVGLVGSDRDASTVKTASAAVVPAALIWTS